MVNTIVATKTKNTFGIRHLTRIHRLNSIIFFYFNRIHILFCRAKLMRGMLIEMIVKLILEVDAISRIRFYLNVTILNSGTPCVQFLRRKWWSRMWLMMTSHKMQCESMRSVFGPFTRYTKFVLRKLCMQRRALHRNGRRPIPGNHCWHLKMYAQKIKTLFEFQ